MSDLREHLDAIAERNAGRLTPAMVVEEARDEASPLHAYVFNKSVRSAAEAYYLARARELIRSQRCVYREADDKDAEKSVRAYHAVRREDGYAFERAEDLVKDEFASRLVMADMRREWMALKRRYEDFAEFWALVREDSKAA